MATAEFNLLEELGQVSKKAIESDPSLERQIEDTVALLNFLLARIDRNCERWSDAVVERAAPFEWSLSRDLAELYQSWLTLAHTLSAALDRSEAFRQLQHVDEFREGIRRVSLMSLDTDRTKRSVESLQQGRGMSLDTAREWLRDKLR